ncbi:MAG: hypothetical protein AAGH92_03155 [Planctomycetota bacterium]
MIEKTFNVKPRISLTHGVAVVVLVVLYAARAEAARFDLLGDAGVSLVGETVGTLTSGSITAQLDAGAGSFQQGFSLPRRGEPIETISFGIDDGTFYSDVISHGETMALSFVTSAWIQELVLSSRYSNVTAGYRFADEPTQEVQLDGGGRDQTIDKHVISLGEGRQLAAGERVEFFLIDAEAGGFSLDEFSAVLAAPIMFGDFDASGQVAQGDLNLVLNNWGGPRGNWSNAQGFANTQVDQEELNAVLNNWGSSTAPSFASNPGVVPEPGLAVAGLVGLVGVRRRRMDAPGRV